MSAVGRIVSGTDPQISSSAPQRQADRDAILAELEQILSSHLFRNSKRCNTLLRYVVNEVLEGRGEQLKERTVGMSAFGREPNYDTNEDTIVRTSAMEVRKRLAQYYHEIGHETPIRIDMASGSYVPEFRFADPVALEPSRQAVEVRPETGAHAVSATAKIRRLAPVLLLAALAIAASIVFAAVEWRPADPLKEFWGPVWHNADTVIIAAGTSVNEVIPPSQTAAPGAEPNTLDTLRADEIGFADAMTMARVAGLLQSRGKQAELRRAATLTLDDLRKMPAVLVGAVNNPWTMRLNASLRFHIERDGPTGVVQIVDRQKNSATLWSASAFAPYSRRTQDWAVISRFSDPRTEQIVLLVAGVGRDGTTAASEFITQSKYLAALAKQAPTGWQRKNLQVVISTEVINGNVGPPRILATYFW